MPGTADDDAITLAVVRYWVEQAVFIMGQTSRCCTVSLIPQSQLSASLVGSQQEQQDSNKIHQIYVIVDALSASLRWTNVTIVFDIAVY